MASGPSVSLTCSALLVLENTSLSHWPAALIEWLVRRLPPELFVRDVLIEDAVDDVEPERAVI